MGPESLYVKDPAASRFVAGGMAEAESLLGSPLPQLPPAEAADSGRYFYGVRFDPKLRAELQKFLRALLVQIGATVPPTAGGRAEPPEKVQADYEASLGRLLRSVRSTDRRQGLLNLFDERLSPKLNCRNIDGHLNWVARNGLPCHSLLARAFENKGPERNNETAFFRDRNEFIGRNAPQRRVLPAC